MNLALAASFVINTVFLTPIPPMNASYLPEPGSWHDPARSGEGAYVDRQGGRMAITIFTYDPDGSPVFYVAGGPFGGSVMGYGTHRLSTRLVRTRNGPLFNADQLSGAQGEGYEAEEVGNLEAVFSGINTLELKIELDEGHVPEGGEALIERQYQRLMFGYQMLGTNTDPQTRASRPGCWLDMSGQWVFSAISHFSGRGAAYNISFDGRESTPPIDEIRCNGQAGMDHVLTFHDTRQEYSLRCIGADADISAVDDAGGHEKGRCVLRDAEGEALLWFAVSDIGLKQILAERGAPPEDDPERTVSERSYSMMLGTRQR